MPLSQEEFELGLSDLAIPIANILKAFPDQAFTADEVEQLLIEMDGRSAAIEDIVQALGSLVVQQRVRTKEIAGQQWYNIPRRRLGFLRE